MRRQMNFSPLIMGLLYASMGSEQGRVNTSTPPPHDLSREQTVHRGPLGNVRLTVSGNRAYLAVQKKSGAYKLDSGFEWPAGADSVVQRIGDLIGRPA